MTNNLLLAKFHQLMNPLVEAQHYCTEKPNHNEASSMSGEEIVGEMRTFADTYVKSSWSGMMLALHLSTSDRNWCLRA